MSTARHEGGRELIYVDIYAASVCLLKLVAARMFFSLRPTKVMTTPDSHAPVADMNT